MAAAASSPEVLLAPTLNPKHVVVVGIDPGLSGGLAALDREGGLVLAVMPVVENVLDPAGLARILRGWEPAHAFLERGQAMRAHGRQQGGSSMFKFGRVCGIVEGVLAGLGIPYTLVPPQRWQRAMHAGVEGSVASPKARSLVAVRRLFPLTDLRASPRCRVAHEGLVDALLLAAWGLRGLQPVVRDQAAR